jgi:hypothetical protein
MKTPRTSDFDPAAKERELKSSMQDFPVIEQPKQIQPAGRTQDPVRPVPPVREIPSAIPARRKIKPRHPFDIYEDQDAALRELAVEDRMRGGSGSMSRMVREAIDDFIANARRSNTSE